MGYSVFAALGIFRFGFLIFISFSVTLPHFILEINSPPIKKPPIKPRINTCRTCANVYRCMGFSFLIPLGRSQNMLPLFLLSVPVFKTQIILCLSMFMFNIPVLFILPIAYYHLFSIPEYSSDSSPYLDVAVFPALMLPYKFFLEDIIDTERKKFSSAFKSLSIIEVDDEFLKKCLMVLTQCVIAAYFRYLDSMDYSYVLWLQNLKVAQAVCLVDGFDLGNVHVATSLPILRNVKVDAKKISSSFTSRIRHIFRTIKSGIFLCPFSYIL